MNLEEFTSLEQELEASFDDVKTFLKEKGISTNTYYYWRRRFRELKEESASTVGQFLPIDVHGSGLTKSLKRGKTSKQPLVSQGEIEIELRTPAGAEIRIRGYMDSIMVSTIIATSGGRGNV